LSAGLVVSELLLTTPIRFEEPKKDYTKVRNTECVELVFPSPSKYTTTDISNIIDRPSPIIPKRKQNYNIMNDDTPRKKKLKQKILKKKKNRKKVEYYSAVVTRVYYFFHPPANRKRLFV